MNVAEKNDANTQTTVQTKRPYATPVLSEYGDIHQITRNTNASPGFSDNPGQMNNKS
jgi:hypothetical protein